MNESKQEEGSTKGNLGRDQSRKKMGFPHTQSIKNIQVRHGAINVPKRLERNSLSTISGKK